MIIHCTLQYIESAPRRNIYKLMNHTLVNYDFDRDVFTFCHWSISPFLLIWYWYLSRRYIIERTLIHHNIFHCKEGLHCKHWQLNKNIKTWSIHYKSGRFS